MIISDQDLKIELQDSVTQNPDTLTAPDSNIISDATYHDQTNILFRTSREGTDLFPFMFIEKNKALEQRTLETLRYSLKNGKEIPHRLFHGTGSH